MQPRYQYKAVVTDVYDGDSITVDIDLGLRTWVKGVKLRLKNINSPELRGDQRPEGTAARDFLRSLILNKEVMIETFKDRTEKYGRYIADVYVEYIGIDTEHLTNGELVDICDLMIEAGHAQFVQY